jgi:ribonuclease HI
MRFANPSNNEAKYEAVLHGMRMAKACGTTRIKIHRDSNLITQQVMKECDATYANMIAYRTMYDKLEGNFEGCEVTHIGRESNEEADNLANTTRGFLRGDIRTLCQDQASHRPDVSNTLGG